MKGRIALDEEYMKCIRLAGVSHLSRYIERNTCETGATLLRHWCEK